MAHIRQAGRAGLSRTILSGASWAIAVLVFAGCEVVGPFSSGSPPSPSTSPSMLTVAVAAVVDGDTIRVRLGGVVERVRILGLDTPEVDPSNRTPACYGEEASAFAEERLGGRTVRLELDPTQDERDQYGRLLAHVFVDGELFAASVIAGGYGIHYVHDRPSLHATELEAAEAVARRTVAGLWSACDGRVDLPLASP